MEQSIIVLLTTPIGSRVSPCIVTAANGERLSIREYGCGLFRHVDKPLNEESITNIVQDVAEAIDRWEPRVRLEHVRPVEVEPGRIVIGLSVIWLETGESRSISFDPSGVGR